MLHTDIIQKINEIEQQWNANEISSKHKQKIDKVQEKVEWKIHWK